jgi:catalase
MSGSAAPGTVIAQIVETMRALAGSHPGFRPVHAKGIVCSGTFRGAPQARGVSRAPHLQGQAVPTVIRFANASGNPDVHDGLANTRSLAVKFQLADGKSADVLANSIEGFPVRTPEDFLAVPAGATPGPCHRPARTRCVPPLPRQSPRRARLH